MSTFERSLTVWVALCIIVGIALGHFFPTAFHVIGSAEVAKVNLPVATLIWLPSHEVWAFRYVRFWPKADMTVCAAHVRFRG